MEGSVMGAVTVGTPGHRVAARAAQIARERHAPLVLLHVVDDDLLRFKGGSFHRPTGATKEIEAEGQDLIEAAAASLPNGAPKPMLLVRHGRVLEMVAQAVREHDVRVLVVGAHRRRLLQAHRGHDWERFKRETGVELVLLKD